MDQHSPEFYQAIFDAMPYSFAVLDAGGRIVGVNAEWRRIARENAGEAAGDFIGWDYIGICAGAGDEAPSQIAYELRELLAGRQDSVSLEYPCHSPETKRWFLLYAARLDSRHGTYAVVSHLDITKRRLAEMAARHQAARDELTGLLNRTTFQQRLEQALHSAGRRPHRRVAVLFFDLDDFKAINDELGHTVGDDVLIGLAERLRQGFRGEDAAARFGGDEFLMFAEYDGDAGGLERVLERLHEEVTRPLRSGRHDIRVTASVGIAVYPTHGSDVEELLEQADAAMYQAKERGKSTSALPPAPRAG